MSGSATSGDLYIWMPGRLGCFWSEYTDIRAMQCIEQVGNAVITRACYNKGLVSFPQKASVPSE